MILAGSKTLYVKSDNSNCRFWALSAMVARLHGMQEVAGSNPAESIPLVPREHVHITSGIIIITAQGHNK